jgi:hypothetical protein
MVRFWVDDGDWGHGGGGISRTKILSNLFGGIFGIFHFHYSIFIIHSSDRIFVMNNEY